MIEKSDRILVTGATGFVGKSLCRILKDSGYTDFIGLRHGISENNEVDLLDWEDTLGVIGYWKPKCIINLAGVVGGIGANRNQPGRFTYENLQMGLNIVEAARIKGVEKIVMIGTVCCYPCNTPVPFKEDQLFNGMPEITNSGYGIAKRALIKLCSEYNKQYGMKNISLLPVNLVGPGEHFSLENSHVIPSLIMKFDNAIKRGEKEVTLWGTGEASREFLYVDDCSRGIVASICCDVHEGPINLGTGKEITIYDLANRVAELMEYDGKILWDTTKPDGQPRRCLDVSLAKRVLGWEATTSLSEGLVNTIQYYKENYR